MPSSIAPPTTPYQVPDRLYKVMSNLEYEEGLAADDPRYVDTLAARNSQELFAQLQRKFCWWEEENELMPPERKHVLFFGHVGSGKTTELRHYRKRFNESGLFFALEVDINSELDRQNLQFPDLIMAMAKVLLENLHQKGILIDESALRPLHEWFQKTIHNRFEENALQAEVKTGAEAKLSLPYLGRLFASITSSLRTGVTYRKEIREEIRNSFSQLATVFNEFLCFAERTLEEKTGAKRVLFILDGTDKLRDEDAILLFVTDYSRVQSINALAIYTAPLHLAYRHNLLVDNMILPMIKITERDGRPCFAGRRALRQLLLLRADRTLFVEEECIEELVSYSGGHPRELLRLLKYCCEFADNKIDQQSVQRAISGLAAEYRRFLAPKDYSILVAKDVDAQHEGNDEETKHLLFLLALLEYNNGSWQRSHPVVRTLEGYQRAQTVWEQAQAQEKAAVVATTAEK